MRAVWYEKNGPAADVLRDGTLPDPKPAQDEVLVRVGFSGVNLSDTRRRDGWGGQPIGFPKVVPHNDGAGRIVAVGDGVDRRRIGERVWLHNAGWKRPLGTLAELVALPSVHAVSLPTNVSLAVGACLGVPALTAYHALFADGPLEGKSVLVQGGAGSVGFYAVNLAKWAGATVIATVDSESKAVAARRAGADVVVNFMAEDVAEKALASTNGGVERIVDVDFGGNMATTIKALRPNGSIATYASMTDPEPKLPFYTLMRQNVLLRMFLIYEIAAADRDAAHAGITRWLSSGIAQHAVTNVFALSEAIRAHQAVESGKVVGQSVVDVGGELEEAK